jgi:hypothetical protein
MMNKFLSMQKSELQKIKTIHLEKEVSINKILRLLRRYWQRGQTINALVPDYENSGGKGQKRAIGDKIWQTTHL